MSANRPPPGTSIIDMHRHSGLWVTDAEREAFVQATIVELEDSNIEYAVLMARNIEVIDALRQALPDRLVFGPNFPCYERGVPEGRCAWDEGDWPSIKFLREQFESGGMGVMGEMLFSYAGVSPTNPRVEPYWALAAEFDVPVGIHSGPGPPAGGGARQNPGCCPKFNSEFGNPTLYRPILEQYPGLRIWLQHAWDAAGQRRFVEERFGILAEFPNVYVDLSVAHSVMPEVRFREVVREYRRRGFIDRIMFGTDGWPAGPIIALYQRMEFLTDAERQGILRDNAARFLRLDERGGVSESTAALD